MKAKNLLADDDEGVLAALNGVLESEGYEVILAKDGREALEHFHEGRIDIALLEPVESRLSRITGKRPITRFLQTDR